MNMCCRTFKEVVNDLYMISMIENFVYTLKQGKIISHIFTNKTARRDIRVKTDFHLVYSFYKLFLRARSIIRF